MRREGNGGRSGYRCIMDWIAFNVSHSHFMGSDGALDEIIYVLTTVAVYHVLE